MKKKLVLIFIFLVLIIVGAVYFFGNDLMLGKKMEKRKYIVGTTAELAPMEYIDEEGNIVGIDINIAQEIASRLGIKIEFKNYSWENMLVAAETGEVDFAMASIIITPEREERMLFSTPYFDGGQIVVTHKDSDISSCEDLKDKRVGVVGGTTCEKAGKQYVDPESLIIYDSFDDTVADTVSGEIDATIIDYIIGLAWEKDNPELKAISKPFTVAYYGIATNKDNVELMEKINKVIRDMKREGKIKEIQRQWQEE